jgi:predicted unusual protein kinase regulating ubiquinone biosynthesis (AarF/ABC1/UbiB family)
VADGPPTSRWGRLARLAALAPRAALAATDPLALGLTLERTLGELKAGSSKVGQLVAQVADDLPPAVRARLGHLYADVPPVPFAALAEALATVPPFTSLAEVPLAAASLGQVHPATLPGGARVVVKVQYPGAREALTADVDTLRRVAGTVTLGGRLVEVGPALDALGGDTLAELDYRAEADRRDLLAAAVAPWPELVVPAVHRAWSSGVVLTLDLLDGPTLHRWLDSAPEEAARARVAGMLVRAVVGAALRGVVNADAHPGNFVVLDGGRALGLLDFGAVAPFPRAAALAGLLRTLGSDRLGADELAAVGFHLDTTPDRRRAYAADVALALRPLGGRHDFAAGSITAALGAIKQRRPRDTLRARLDPELLPLARALLGLHHALRRLATPIDVAAEVAALLTAPATDPPAPR